MAFFFREDAMHPEAETSGVLQPIIAYLFGSSKDLQDRNKVLQKEVGELRKENEVLKGENEVLKGENEVLWEMAYHDPLTGLKNRRAFNEMSAREHARAVRTGRPFCICIIDIDHFKRINDTYGHDDGDLVLKHVSKILLNLTRESDCVARWGGEEFSVLLPETSVEQAAPLVDRLRTHLVQNPVALGEVSVSVTISLGIAEWTEGDDLKDLTVGADKALYEAKRTGRNKVCVHKKG